MFLEILAISLLLSGAIVLCIDFVTESILRKKLIEEIPGVDYAIVEDIKYDYTKEYGTTYCIKARKRDGTTKSVEVKCKDGNVKKYERIKVC